MTRSLSQIELNGRISDAVYDTLRDAILSRKLKAGESLSVPELARRLGVSRSPVREAVLQLVANGLGTSEPRKGAVVAQTDPESLLAIHDVRELLEGLSVRRASLKATPRDISKLDGLLKEQARAVKEKNAHLFESTDEDFHSYISDINPEPKLVQFLRILRDQMQLAVTVAITNPEHIERAYLEHKAILKALSEHDSTAAELAMRAHIVGSKERVAETLRQSPEDKPSKRVLSKLEIEKLTLEDSGHKQQSK